MLGAPCQLRSEQIRSAHWYGREGDVHVGVLAALWREFCFGAQYHMCVHQIRSSEVIGGVGCMRRFAGSVVQMAKRCLDHSIVSGEKWKRWNLSLGLEEAQRGVVPIKRSSVSVLNPPICVLCQLLTELSNFALFLLFPSRMLSRLISALASCSLRALRELVTEPPSPSLLL